MAGRVIRVIPKTFVSFSTSTAGQVVNQPLTMTNYLARRVDISMWREVTLYARLHTPSVVGAMGTLPTIVAFADGFTDEDPSPATAGVTNFPTFFSVPLTLANNAFAQNANTQIQMLMITIPTNSGGLISIGVQAKQPTPAVTCDIYLSVDLSGKE